MRSDSPENVSELIAKPAEQYTPEPRYVSKYREKIRKDFKRGKSAHKTLGVASVVLDQPGQYLKKRASSAARKKPHVRHEHYRRPGYQRKLPDWQPIKASDRDEQRVSASQVDFTKRNADEARNLKPTKPRKYYVDDRHGNAHPLKTSGLFPYYRNRKNYGQVPGNVSPAIQKRSESPRQRSPMREATEERKKKSKPERKREEPTRKAGTTIPQRAKVNKLKGQKEKHKESTRAERETTTKGDKLKGQKDEKSARAERETTMKGDKSKGQKSEKSAEAERETTERDKLNGQKGEETARAELETTTKDDKLEKEEKLENEEKSDRTNEKKEDVELKAESFKEEIGVSSYVNDERVSTAASTDRIDRQQPRCRYVTEDERAQLLHGMKSKWDEMMKQFQCLPILTDTAPKAKRKSKMEKDLLELEKDIETIDRHPYIYVYSDPED